MFLSRYGPFLPFKICITYCHDLLARAHPLSTYTPLCMSCGLVLCSINPPHFACPHCLSPLVPSNPRRAELLAVLEAELAEQERKEEEERIRQKEARKAAAGAFPTLAQSSSTGPGSAAVPAAPTTHKVLSIGGAKAGGKKGKVTLSSYTQSPASSQQSSRAPTPGPREPEIVRVPPPPAERAPVLVASRDKSRPFKNLVHPDASGLYIPPPEADKAVGGSKRESGGRRRNKAKGGGEKGKEKENQDVALNVGDEPGRA